MNILSFGAGWQSSVLYFLSSTRQLPVRFDAAIFSDTGREQRGTYEFLRFLQVWQKENNGVPIIWTGKRTLYRDLIHGTSESRFASIPLFTLNKDGSTGMLRRQCTNEYKISIVEKEVRQLQGLKPKQRNKHCNMFIGLTTDELNRFSKNEVKAWDNIYPLAGGFVLSHNPETRKRRPELDFSMHTNDCPKWLEANGFPVPPRSRCTFCTYQTDSMWLDMKKNDPHEWEAVCKLDEAIRNSTKMGFKQPVFLHRSCVPLRDAPLGEQQHQFMFDCSGTCDT